MRKYIFILTIVLSFCWSINANAGKSPSNWKKWDMYPKVPIITGEQVKQLMLSGEKIIFIYAGYEIEKTVCGSIFIPYTNVPPHASGSKYNLKFPKDTWLLAYCP
ncbi:MAG: hypothetical protein KKE44_05095 [Proteobacteria bacterium]|nr:hypothetical protein [Pseudomonadota bacterium]MBU1582110.1 hypothetical protein [Pseudomonadota bacterium]MBU2453218.1 hypothetical protein [Pseudomonadota bacterium]